MMQAVIIFRNLILNKRRVGLTNRQKPPELWGHFVIYATLKKSPEICGVSFVNVSHV
jgi:hypothetical protein